MRIFIDSSRWTQGSLKEGRPGLGVWVAIEVYIHEKLILSVSISSETLASAPSLEMEAQLQSLDMCFCATTWEAATVMM